MSKTLKKGKRLGLTRNQKRKTDYAAQASKSRSSPKEGSGGVVTTSSRSPTRGKRSNQKRGTQLADKEARRAEAQARQAFYDSLTPLQKLEGLDKLFGKGLGAKKERAKIDKLMKNETKPVEASKGGLTNPQAKNESLKRQSKKEAHDKKRREEHTK